MNQKLKKNADGTVDCLFRAPATRWPRIKLDSARDRMPFFVMFRIYGPQKGATEGSWVLNDVEKMK